jgi:hypothetical protein
MRILAAIVVGSVFGFFVGVSFPTLSLTKVQKLVQSYLNFPYSSPFVPPPNEALPRLVDSLFVMSLFGNC